jgi:hypothetical protein
MKKFHENLCRKITADGGDYRVVLFGQHASNSCKDWFPQEKILNREAIPHGSYIRNNFPNSTQRDSFAFTLDLAAAFLSGNEPLPINGDKIGELLHVGVQANSQRTTTRESRKRARETPEETVERKKRKEEKEASKLAERKKREEEEASKMTFSFSCSHIDEKGKRCKTPAFCRGVCQKHGEKCSHIDEKGERCKTPAFCRGVCCTHGEKCSHVDKKRRTVQDSSCLPWCLPYPW